MEQLLNKRISIKDLEPEAYKAMLAMESYVKTIEVDPKLKELIKIRASQLNGCAYCVDMHTEHAIKVGESERRIFALSVWKESHLFTDDERAVFQLTDEVTLIAAHGVRNKTYDTIVNFFGEKITAQIIMQIVLINSWNRIAVSTKMIYK